MNENTPPAAAAPLPRRLRNSRRAALAVVAHLGALAGLVLEANRHLSRYLMDFDPLKDPVRIGFFLFGAAMLLVNEYALHLRWRHIRWLWAVAVIGTGAALPVALGTTIVFAPVLLLSLPRLAYYRLGPLFLVPLLASVVLLAQFHALWQLGREGEEDGRLPLRRTVIMSGLAFLVALGWFAPVLLARLGVG